VSGSTVIIAEAARLAAQKAQAMQPIDSAPAPIPPIDLDADAPDPTFTDTNNQPSLPYGGTMSGDPIYNAVSQAQRRRRIGRPDLDPRMSGDPIYDSVAEASPEGEGWAPSDFEGAGGMADDPFPDSPLPYAQRQELESTVREAYQGDQNATATIEENRKLAESGDPSARAINEHVMRYIDSMGDGSQFGASHRGGGHHPAHHSNHKPRHDGRSAAHHARSAAEHRRLEEKRKSEERKRREEERRRHHRGRRVVEMVGGSAKKPAASPIPQSGGTPNAQAAAREIARAAKAISQKYRVDHRRALTMASTIHGDMGCGFGREVISLNGLHAAISAIAENIANPNVPPSFLKEQIDRMVGQALVNFDSAESRVPAFFQHLPTPFRQLALVRFLADTAGFAPNVRQEMLRALQSASNASWNLSAPGFSGDLVVEVKHAGKCLSDSMMNGDGSPVEDSSNVRNMAMAVRMAHGPLLTERAVRDMSASFGTERGRVLFMQGFNAPYLAVRASPTLSRMDVACIRAGQCAGAANRLQVVRNPRVSLSAISPVVASEIGCECSVKR
jgi:hypothetical protein